MDLDNGKDNSAENRVLSAIEENRGVYDITENRGNSVTEENRGYSVVKENSGNHVTGISMGSTEIRENKESSGAGENRASNKSKNNAEQLQGQIKGSIWKNAEQVNMVNKAAGKKENVDKNQRRWRVGFNERANLKGLRNQITKMLV